MTHTAHCLACARPWTWPQCAHCGSRSVWREEDPESNRKPIGPILRSEYASPVGRPPRWLKALRDLEDAQP